MAEFAFGRRRNSTATTPISMTAAGSSTYGVVSVMAKRPKSTDDEAVARAHEVFDPIAEGYLARADVDIGPMFGSEAVRVRGKVFAFIGHAGDLIVKLPEERVDELASRGEGARMTISERMLREWAVLDLAHSARWADVVAEAFAYVDRITPRPPR